MNSDRDGRRNNRGRGRYNGRGYKRGRGHYYSQNYSWKQSKTHQSQYAIPVQKPPSPLPGTEEYRQRRIQQTSELIKKQMNIDSDTCENSSIIIPPLMSISIEKDLPSTPQPSTSTTEPKKKTRRKKIEEIDVEIDVQDIYDKIIKHICSLSHSKKMNLIEQGNSGYDIALQQIQKQKQLELSRALRDMSKRPAQAENDGDIINGIIPDIGIKLEDLPNNVIEELSKTLQVKFEDSCTGTGNLIDEVICPDVSKDVAEQTFTNTSAINDTIENIFDFEYLNKAQDDTDLSFEVNDESFVEGVEDDFGNSSDFILGDIDVSKSYLSPTNTSSALQAVDNNCNDPKSSDSYPVIRVKKDIFKTSRPETETVITPSEPEALETDNTLEITAENKSNIFSSQLQKNTLENTCTPEPNNIFHKIIECPTKNSFISPLDDIRYMRNSPLLRQLSNPSNLSQEQTENTNTVSDQESTLVVTPPKLQEIPPKRWKSPGEKKMINYEQTIAGSTLSPNEVSDVRTTIFEQMEEFNRCMSVVTEKEKKCHTGQHTKQKTSSRNIPENGLDSLNKISSLADLNFDKSAEEDITTDLGQMDCDEISDLKLSSPLNDDKSLSQPSEIFLPSNESTMMNTLQSADCTDSCENITESLLLNSPDLTVVDMCLANVSTPNIIQEPKEMREIGTMTVKIESNIPITVTNIETQTPAAFNKPKLKNISIQTVQKQFLSTEVQAVQNLQTKVSQTETVGTEIDEFKIKCKSYSEAIKNLREIDEQIQNLIDQKNKIYESLKMSPSKLKLKKPEVGSKPDRNTGESSKSSPNHKKVKEDKKREEKPDISKHKPKKKRHKSGDDSELNKKRQKVSFNTVSNVTVAVTPEIPTISGSFKKPPKIENQEKTFRPNKNDKIDTETKNPSPIRNRSRSRSKDREISTIVSERNTTIPLDDNVKYFDKDKRIKISKECEPLLVKNDKLFKKQCRVELLGYSVSLLEGLKKVMKTSSDHTTGGLPPCRLYSNQDELDCSVHSLPDTENSNQSEGVTSDTVTPSTTNNSDPGKDKVRGISKVIDKTEYKGISGTIFALESADEVLLAAGDNGVLYFFKILSKDLLSELSLSTKALSSLFVTRSNEECLIYVGSLDEYLRVVDFNTRQLQKTINVGSGIQCIDVCWGYVFMGSITGDVLIYDIKKQKLEQPIKIYENRIYSIKATQEGARRVLLTSTKNSEVTIRDAMTGLLLRTMQSHLSPTVYTILLDQNLVYCASSQHDVLVHSFQNGELVNRYKSLASRRVVCMQIVGNLIYVGCFNGTVCVFHKTTHRYLGQMIRRGEMLISMLIVKNKVIVGTKNNKLVSWDIPNTYLERDG